VWFGRSFNAISIVTCFHELIKWLKEVGKLMKKYQCGMIWNWYVLERRIILQRRFAHYYRICNKWWSLIILHEDYCTYFLIIHLIVHVIIIIIFAKFTEFRSITSTFVFH
jgi:hypothetical protein